jgi:hypothetical protein
MSPRKLRELALTETRIDLNFAAHIIDSIGPLYDIIPAMFPSMIFLSAEFSV